MPNSGGRLITYNYGDGNDIALFTPIPLSVAVNKSTGEVQIQGNPTTTTSIDYYQLLSPGNALDPVPWDSLDDQDVSAVDGDDEGSTAGDSPGEGWDASPNVPEPSAALLLVLGLLVVALKRSR